MPTTSDARPGSVVPFDIVRDPGTSAVPRDPAAVARVARLAAASASAPLAIVTFVAGDRLVVGAVAGDSAWLAPGVPLDPDATLCGAVAGRGAPLACADAAADPSLVSRAASLDARGYLGVPVRAPDGRVVGTVCVIDRAPRTWTDDDAARLADLAALVEDGLALRRETDERRRARADEARLEQQLREAQKLEAVGRLAHGVAHDFNNLLTVVGTSARFVREAVCDVLPPALAAEAQADLDEIDRAVRSAGTLTRQLLGFGRPHEPAARPTCVADVVRGVEQMAVRVVGGDVEVAALLDPAAGTVLADRGQLEQVLLNLVVNARDAMPHGGVLLLEARPAASDELARDGVPAGPWAVVEVSDTGVGIDDATRGRLFEPFFTTKPPGSGTGLGLATVYGIVTRAGGHVRVRSVPDRGTTFTVYLPRGSDNHDQAPVVPAADGTCAPATAPRAHPGETVLVVEDETAVRHAARRVLERHGYRVLEARHGVDGLRAWAAYGGAAGDVHLVLTDQRMPEMGGQELVPRLRARRPQQAVLVMTGLADDADRGTPVVSKPFGAVELATRVRAALDAAPASKPPALRGS